MTSDVCSRTARTVSRRRTASRLGLWSASRIWMWIREAPAAWQVTAASTSSANVVGSWGQSPLAVSAPVGATVMRVPAAREVARLIRVASLVMPDILSGAIAGDAVADVWPAVFLPHRAKPRICGRENRDVCGAQGLCPRHPEALADHCGSHARGPGGGSAGDRTQPQGLRSDDPALRLDVGQQ